MENENVTEQNSGLSPRSANCSAAVARSGKIIFQPNFRVKCDLCVFEGAKDEYQEASMLLSRHLDLQHPDWNGQPLNG